MISNPALDLSLSPSLLYAEQNNRILFRIDAVLFVHSDAIWAAITESSERWNKVDTFLVGLIITNGLPIAFRG